MLGILRRWSVPSGLAAAAAFALAAFNTMSIQAAGTKLVFDFQPSNSTAGQPWGGFSPSAAVSIRDAAGNADSTNNTTVVTLNITAGTGASGAVLTCDDDQNLTAPGVQTVVANGLAVYFNCSIDKGSQSPYTLTATASGLTSAVSNSFVITGPASTPSPTPTATVVQSTPTATSTPAASPTPTSTATPVVTPTATATPAPAPSPTTRPVGTTGGDVEVGGGPNADGGVGVKFPQGALPGTVTVTLAIINAPPPGVNAPSGTRLLAKTIDVTLDPPVVLGQGVEIRINLTPAELGGRDINNLQIGVIVNGSVDPRPTRVVDAAQGILAVTVDHFTKFSVLDKTDKGATLGGPADAITLPGIGVDLSWTNPAGTTQNQVQVLPFNFDGPAVNLIRNAETSLSIGAPNIGVGSYILLPGMTYMWRVRSTSSASFAPESDPSWSAYSVRSFRTAPRGSDGVRPVAPANGATVATTSRVLQWDNADKDVFYYEIQMSGDTRFDANPTTATSFVYWNLVHGGVTTPVNSWQAPPLDAGTKYYWRVRPRVQGDGTEVAWGPVWSFTTAGTATPPPSGPSR